MRWMIWATFNTLGWTIWTIANTCRTIREAM